MLDYLCNIQKNETPTRVKEIVPAELIIKVYIHGELADIFFFFSFSVHGNSV